jgi:hypothetical protein
MQETRGLDMKISQLKLGSIAGRFSAETSVLQDFLGKHGTPSSACHAEGRGFESLQPLSGKPRKGQASVRHLASIRSVVGRLAEEAALRDPASLPTLMKGSIVSAAEGDAEAAQRARSMARLLIEQHR